MGFRQQSKAIKAEQHVRVERCRDESGTVFFRKRFDPWLEKEGWPQRENRILLHMLVRQSAYPRGLVRPYGSSCDQAGEIGPVVETHDAGRSIKDWKNIGVRSSKTGTGLDHPFQHCLHWWALLEAVLTALDGLHKEGFVHLDIKEDNVCVPELNQDRGTLSLDFENLRLIDVTFSLLKTMPLERSLPLKGDPSYQSSLLVQAIEKDRQSGYPYEANRLDWRVDLFSLGAMMARLRGSHADASHSGWNVVLANRAQEIVEELKAGSEDHWPHQELLTKVRNVLSSLDTLDRAWLLEKPREVAGDGHDRLVKQSWADATFRKLSLGRLTEIAIILAGILIILMLMAQSLQD